MHECNRVTQSDKMVLCEMSVELNLLTVMVYLMLRKHERVVVGTYYVPTYLPTVIILKARISTKYTKGGK